MSIPHSAKPQFFAAADLQLQREIPGSRYFGVSLTRAMLTYFEVEPWSCFPEHHHESEQITLVLSGRLVFEFAKERIVVGPGEVIAIPADLPHAVASLDEPVTAVDAWSPPREGLLSQEGSANSSAAIRPQKQSASTK